jgi:Cu+-exporting ATPase
MQASKADVLKRLAHIEGHLKGIRRMVEEDQYCVDVLKQTYAVKQGLFWAFAYLLTIAIVALSIGAASLAFAQTEDTDGDSSGHSSMNTRAMHTQTGDPHTLGVHPATTALQTDSTHVELIAPASLLAGQPVTLTYRLTDTLTDAPVTDIVESHERPMHLIAVSRDLQKFQHIHPEPTDTAGEYRVETTFPDTGTYYLFDEFNRSSGAQIVERDELTVDAPSVEPASLTEDIAPKTYGTVRVGLTGADGIRAGQEAVLTFHLEDASTGVPIHDLQPYLGAPAHGVVLSEDAATFAHTHGEAVGAESDGHASMPNMPGMPGMSHGTSSAAGFGPEIAIHHTFETPGLFKLWGQFQTKDGAIITADFVVRVAG